MNKLPIEEIALPGQVVCGNIKCHDRYTCYHGEPHYYFLSCFACEDQDGCLPVEEAIKLATIEAAEDEGQRRML